MNPFMDSSRPIAQKRLDRALEVILSGSADQPREFAFSDLRRKLDLISQEKRFMLVMYLLRETSSCTDYEIATAVRDQRSNVVRNLHVLVSERIVLPSRDETTGIVRYQINRRMMDALSELLRPKGERSSGAASRCGDTLGLDDDRKA
jgi:hypothetical protein